MPYEARPADEIPERLEMVEARRGRGTYTDDTQMMVALAESLLERGRVDQEHLGRAFAAAFDPDRGYGEGTTDLLRQVREGASAAEVAAGLFDGQGSLGNGASMRIAPVAVRFAHDPVRLAEQAELSARVTHAHLFAIDAARVQAAAIAAALRDDDILEAAFGAAVSSEMAHRIDALAARLGIATMRAETPEDFGDEDAPLGNSTIGHESVPTAVYAAVAHAGFEEAVTFAVRQGGDTDTIAAMTGAIAGAREGASAIPSRWLDALEEGEKGRSYVESLADRLSEASGA